MDSITNNNNIDTLNYKGHSFSVSRRLREYHVFHTGYDVTPADVTQALVNQSKEEGVIQKELMESEEALSHAVEKYMRAKIRVYKYYMAQKNK